MGGQSLVFRADPHLAAIGLARVTEVLRPLPVRWLAGAPPSVRGFCVLRGRAVPVVCVATVLGGERSGARHRSGERFIGILAGGHPAALAVDSVLGIRDVPVDRLDARSSVTGATACEAVGAVDGEPLLVVAADRMLPDAVWDAVEAAA